MTLLQEGERACSIFVLTAVKVRFHALASSALCSAAAAKAGQSPPLPPVGRRDAPVPLSLPPAVSFLSSRTLLQFAFCPLTRTNSNQFSVHTVNSG